MKRTTDELLGRLRELAESRDPEAAHCEGEKIICELLRRIGHGDFAQAFENLDRSGF